MIGNKAFLALLLLQLALAAESPYLGRITLRPLSKGTPPPSVTFLPLSEQPKIANLKNNEVELTLISESDSCKLLPLIDQSSAATLALIDIHNLTRESCSLGMRKMQLKKAGLKGFIVVASSDFYKKYCHMLDDANFLMGVMEPSAFHLVTNYHQSGVETDPEFKVKGVLSIELADSAEQLLEVWTSSLDEASYYAVAMIGRSFQQLETLGKQLRWVPRIVTFDCVHGENPAVCASSDYVASCGCKGEFCSPEIRDKTPGPLVQQDIRQLLIHKQQSSKYFAYMQAFQEKCLEQYRREKYIEQCAANVMETLDIDSYSINSVVDDFLDKCSSEAKIQETYIYSTLHKDQRAFPSYGQYPTITLNKEILDYNNPDDFTGILCSKLHLEDPGCFTIVDNTTTVTHATGILFFLLLVVTLVGVGAGVVYCYRKKLKRDMNKQIKMQVSTAVEHYFALTETSNSAK